MVNENTQQSLVHLAETLADNKFILGDRLVEIGVSGPNLEASLSSIAMAQAELGHARLLYRWSYELQGLKASKAEIKSQTGKAFQPVVDVDNWVSLIANLYTVNVAINLIMKAMLEADHKEINVPFNKMLNEQNDHLIYAKSWCEQLLNDRGAVPQTFISELEKASAEVEQWLTKVENDNELAGEHVLSPKYQLVNEYKATISELTADRKVQNV